MKIISKFTDFYDYDVYRYGEPSPMPEYIRKEDHVNIDLKKNESLCEFITSLFLYNVDPKYDWKGRRVPYYRTTKLYDNIEINEEIVGIYPYLYYIPNIGYDVLNKDEITGIYGNMKFRSFSGEDCLRLLNEKDSFKEILPKYGFDLHRTTMPKQICFAKKNDYLKAIEFPEIFDLVKAPVIHFNRDSFKGYWRYHNELQINTNINISKTPFLKFYPNILDERDIYTEIENWISLSKQEPISIPDNKTKIISHGFDVKTSFRKM